MVLVWLAAPAVALLSEHGPRLIWTMLIAVLPLFWVLGGFHLWRRVCPLGWVAGLPERLGRGGSRKLDLGRRALLLPAGLLFVGLSLRLLGTNGTPAALALFLGVASVAALLTGLVWTGRTWCNHICPVSLVEKIYTQPAQLLDSGNSQCVRCTACTKRCPDIDLEQSYWKGERGGLWASLHYAWPGVVFGFYAAFALRTGSWEDYFSGAWTYRSETLASLMGPGLFFAPAPWAVVAPATLALFGLGSWGLLSAAHGLLAGRSADDAAQERLQHRMLAVSGFTAFGLFYAFAGKPTLALAPTSVQWVFAVIVFVAATLVLVRRWDRTEQDFVRERFAKRLARRWQWGDLDSYQPAELVLVHEERERARKQRLAAWRETMLELAAEGTVDRAQLSALDVLRRQLEISDEEHRKVLDGLEAAERALLDGQGASGRSLQARQYRAALEALLERAIDRGHELDPAVLAHLRDQFGVDEDVHLAVLDELRDSSSAPTRGAAAAVERVAWLGAVTAGARGLLTEPDAAFVRTLCLHEAEPRVRRVLATLRALGHDSGSPEVSDSLEARLTAALEQLDSGRAGPEALEPALTDPSRWVRMAAALSLSCAGRAPAPDADPLVAQAAVAPSSDALGSGTPDLLSRMRLLHAVELFAALSPEDLLQLARHARSRGLEAGAELCEEGDAGDELFVIVTGRVEAWRQEAEGRRHFADFGPGACLGELAVIEPSPRSASVSCLEPTSILELEGAPFRELLLARPSMAEAVMKELARRLRS